MIGSLRGEVLELGDTWALLEVQGIGYRVTAPPHVLASIRSATRAFVYTYDHIREDTHELFGFTLLSDLELFEQLISISGVGPKAAMTILSIGSGDMVRRAIMAGDLTTLTSVPGVGKKTAQKIVLELKGQLVEEDTAQDEDRDAIDALMSLGYSAAQAKEALKGISAMDTSDRIREALKHLSS